MTASASTKNLKKKKKAAGGKSDARATALCASSGKAVLAGNSAPKGRDVPGEGVQLTRGAGAGIAVAPLRGLVTLAALCGAGLGPLLAAQAAVAPPQRGGLGGPQGSAAGLAGSPGGCCRDRTEMLLREREGAERPEPGPAAAGTAQLQPGALRSRVSPSSCALLPGTTSASSQE